MLGGIQVEPKVKPISLGFNGIGWTSSNALTFFSNIGNFLDFSLAIANLSFTYPVKYSSATT